MSAKWYRCRVRNEKSYPSTRVIIIEARGFAHASMRLGLLGIQQADIEYIELCSDIQVVPLGSSPLGYPNSQEPNDV